MVDIVAFTDGGCRGNPGGVGAWAFVLIHCATCEALEVADGDRSTTNNRMELSAVIEALNAIRRRSHVLIVSDSKYVINCGTQWIAGWKRRGWQRKSEPLKNLDLLKQLDASLARHVAEWRWVAGHSGDAGNTRVDELANVVMDRIERGEQARFERRGKWPHRLPSPACAMPGSR